MNSASALAAQNFKSAVTVIGIRTVYVEVVIFYVYDIGYTMRQMEFVTFKPFIRSSFELKRKEFCFVACIDLLEKTNNNSVII